MAKYICADCLFKADTNKKIKEQVLIFPFDGQQDRFHKDCIIQGAEDKGEHYEVVGKPTKGRMVFCA